MFTATAVMKLAEEGKLRLDDKVADYIPWFKAKTQHSDASHITLRQVLSHTAGIFRDGDTPHWQTGRFPTDLKKAFSDKSLVIENQTAFKYTNYGYSLLGLVIEQASGMTYKDYVEKRILRPLGMKNTYVDYQPNLGSIATGYGLVVPDQKRVTFDHYVTHAYAPATGFISNVVDMAKFINMLSLSGGSSVVLDRESKKEMMRPHGKTRGHDEYGLGLDIGYDNDRKSIGHGGGFNGFSTRTVLDTEMDIAIVVLTNAMRSNSSGIALGILDSIARLMNGKDKYSTSKKISALKYDGLYRSVWGDSVIAKAGDILVDFDVETNNPLKNAVRLVPTSMPNIFTLKSKNVFGSYDEPAVFDSFKNGKAERYIAASMPHRRVKGKGV
jgi:CubicO group peptidase (beta-lactamase class C family)